MSAFSRSGLVVGVGLCTLLAACNEQPTEQVFMPIEVAPARGCTVDEDPDSGASCSVVEYDPLSHTAEMAAGTDDPIDPNAPVWQGETGVVYGSTWVCPPVWTTAVARLRIPSNRIGSVLSVDRLAAKPDNSRSSLERGTSGCLRAFTLWHKVLRPVGSVLHHGRKHLRPMLRPPSIFGQYDGVRGADDFL